MYQDLAEKGAALLDEVNPEWWERINLQTLQMNSFINCVLGQLYGDYHEGSKKLRLNEDDDEKARRLGFYPSQEWYDCSDGDEGYRVTGVWRNLILKRRAA